MELAQAQISNRAYFFTRSHGPVSCSRMPGPHLRLQKHCFLKKLSRVRKLTTFYFAKNDHRWVTFIPLKTINSDLQQARVRCRPRLPRRRGQVQRFACRTSPREEIAGRFGKRDEKTFKEPQLTAIAEDAAKKLSNEWSFSDEVRTQPTVAFPAFR